MTWTRRPNCSSSRPATTLPARFNEALIHRRYLCYPSIVYRTHHLHLVDVSEHMQRCLRFRDMLAHNPSLPREYVALKRSLAARFRDDAVVVTPERKANSSRTGAFRSRRCRRERPSLCGSGYEHFRATRDRRRADRRPGLRSGHVEIRRRGPDQQVYEGLEATRSFIRDWNDAWDHLGVRGRTRSSTLRRAECVAVVRPTRPVQDNCECRSRWTFAPGLDHPRRHGACAMEMYADPAEALKAVGLAE